MNVLELFSASGALAYGFKKAGLDILLAFDKDPEACASYHANLGVHPVQVDVHDLLRMARAGWSPGNVDLLVADPPCSPWSRAGKRKGLADERDMLETTVELVQLLKPRAYLIGNIPGLEDGPNLPTVQRLIGGLSKFGYCAQDFAILDAVEYGVPQRRPRPFWYGHRGGACIVWPARTHCNPRELRQMMIPGVDALRPWLTCREALFPMLSAKEIGRPVRVKEPTRKLIREKKTAKGVRSAMRIPQSARLGDIDAPLATLTARPGRVGSGDAAVLAIHPRHPISEADQPARVIGASDGAGAKGGRVLSWPWDRPATTVMDRDVLNPPGHHVEKIRQSPNAVVLSEKAAIILQGLPPDWKLVGKTKASRWAQLGQAVPPAVAEAIARSVLAALPPRPAVRPAGENIRAFLAEMGDPPSEPRPRVTFSREELEAIAADGQ